MSAICKTHRISTTLLVAMSACWRKRQKKRMPRSTALESFQSSRVQRWLAGVLEAARESKKAQAPEPLSEPFTGDLTIVYAEDRQNSMRFLTTRDDVGDRAKLHDLALVNLGRLLPKIEMRPGADGLWLISAGGDYEASLLLAGGIWSSGQIKVDGDIVVAVPAKDALIVTGSRNSAGVARLRKLAAELAAGPYGLTSTLQVYRNGKFVTFDAN